MKFHDRPLQGGVLQNRVQNGGPSVSTDGFTSLKMNAGDTGVGRLILLPNEDILPKDGDHATLTLILSALDLQESS